MFVSDYQLVKNQLPYKVDLKYVVPCRAFENVHNALHRIFLRRPSEILFFGTKTGVFNEILGHFQLCFRGSKPVF